MAADRRSRTRPGRAVDPEVIVDVLFEDGLLFLAIRNISARPAYDVSVTFDPPIVGLDGTRPVASMALFRDLTFLAPGREIRAFLDTSASYFARGQPARVTARIAHRDAARRRRTTTIEHNLEIYRQLGYVRRASASQREE